MDRDYGIPKRPTYDIEGEVIVDSSKVGTEPMKLNTYIFNELDELEKNMFEIYEKVYNICGVSEPSDGVEENPSPNNMFEEMLMKIRRINNRSYEITKNLKRLL